MGSPDDELELEPVAAPEPSRGWLTRRRALVLGGVAAAIVLVAGLLTVAVMGGDGGDAPSVALRTDPADGGDTTTTMQVDAVRTGDTTTTTSESPSTTPVAAAPSVAAAPTTARAPRTSVTTAHPSSTTGPAPSTVPPSSPSPSSSSTTAPQPAVATPYTEAGGALGIGRATTGFWTLHANTQEVTAHDGAPFYGDMRSVTLSRRIVGFASTGAGGYYVLTDDGGLFTFGDAQFHGSTGSIKTYGPITDMWVTGAGYWLLDAGGRMYGFGDAFALPGFATTPPSPAVAVSGRGDGAWVLTESSGVFAVGSAPSLGGGARSGVKAVDLVATISGGGYWVLYEDGVVEAKGDAVAYGNGSSSASALEVTADGKGYWVLHRDGSVVRRGTAAA